MMESGQRGITLAQAAQYCGITEAAYRNWIKEGRVPGFWPGTRRIDRVRLDQALDCIGQDEPKKRVSAYAAWKEATQS